MSSLADGYISSFETKYTYSYWQVFTAIRLAATDGNPATDADPSWTPLRPTPEIPDYDSAHAVEGGAAATVLARFFGTDRFHFATCSTTVTAAGGCSVVRRFVIFSQAAEENGLSRILIGFHFRKAVKEGIAHGGKIANRAIDRFMRPSR